MKKVFFLFLCCLFIHCDALAMAQKADIEKITQGSSLAPDFTLSSINGKTVSLKEFRGKGAILFFFTTMCPFCREKIPFISKNLSKFKEENIEFLAIDCGESQRRVSSFAAKERVDFDILLDSELRASDSYSLVGVPTFVLVGKDGRIVYNANDFPDNYKALLK